MRKTEKEIAAFGRFQALTHDLVEVNQKICRLRLIEGQGQTASRKNGASDPAGSHPQIDNVRFVQSRNVRMYGLEADGERDWFDKQDAADS